MLYKVRTRHGSRIEPPSKPSLPLMTRSARRMLVALSARDTWHCFIGSLFRVQLKPVLEGAGILERQDTFYDTFGTLMKANGEEIKTILEV